MSVYWRYPLHKPELPMFLRAGGWNVWWYGFGWGEWAVGFMVRRPAAPQPGPEEGR